jgi:hypothetical protein
VEGVGKNFATEPHVLQKTSSRNFKSQTPNSQRSYFSTAPLTYQIQFLRLTSDWTYRGAILIKYLSNQTIIFDVMLKNKNRFPPYAVTLLLK